MIAVTGAAVALSATPAATAASISSAANLFGACKQAPLPQLPGSGVPGEITGPPVPLPPAGNPFGRGSRTSEYGQYGFAGLSWHTYDLGCFHVFGIPDVETWAGNGLLWAAKVVVAIDDATHDWASTPGWIAVLNPLVTGATRALHRAVFTPWAAASLGLLALTLLVRAHRAELASAVTTAAWALTVLALVAGVTSYPTWAAQQISLLMASTINSMDAGFAGQSGEVTAANGHRALLVSAVLYPQWVAGELGSSTSPAARRYGPLLLENQALTWRQASAPQQQLAATETTEQKRWAGVASQVRSLDPALYPVLQGTQGSRIGIGALALGDAVIVCSFDIFASTVIVVALLAVLVATILLPALAIVGLHHGLRQAVTGVLSRVAGLLISAVLYSAAAGVDIRASGFLLSSEQALAGVPVSQVPNAVFLSIFAQLMLTIALFLAVRYAKTGRVIPRAAVYGGLLAANLAWRRRAAPATAAGADGAAGTGPRTVIYVVNATQQPSSDDGWNWSATAEPAPPEPRALATAAPPDDAGRPPGESGPGGVGPGPSGGGPAGGSGGSGASGPSASSRGTVSAGFPPQPRRGPTGGTPSNSMVSPPSRRQGRPLTASQGADGTWQVYRGSAEFGDDVPGHGQGPPDDQ